MTMIKKILTGFSLFECVFRAGNLFPPIVFESGQNFWPNIGGFVLSVSVLLF